MAGLGQELPGLQRLILAESDLTGADAVLASAKQAALVACLECWIFAVEAGESWSEEAPAAVKLHARKAARRGVDLPALLRGYVKGRDVLWQGVSRYLEAQNGSSGVPLLRRRAWAASASLLESALAALEEAYRDELVRVEQTAEQQRALLLRRLLRGDIGVDTRLIRHDFAGLHLGLIASGEKNSRLMLDGIAQLVGAHLYCLPEEDGLLPAWLRLRRDLQPAELERHLPADRYLGLVLALGRQAPGLDGFIRTHQQAVQASLIARRRSQRIAWYADVELDVLLLRDEAWARWLVASYIAPLKPEIQQTLKVCYAANWNKSAAGRALGVDRGTITKRLARVAAVAGRPLSRCRFHIELALRATELGIDALDERMTDF